MNTFSELDSFSFHQRTVIIDVKGRGDLPYLGEKPPLGEPQFTLAPVEADLTYNWNTDSAHVLIAISGRERLGDGGTSMRWHTTEFRWFPSVPGRDVPSNYVPQWLLDEIASNAPEEWTQALNNTPQPMLPGSAAERTLVVMEIAKFLSEYADAIATRMVAATNRRNDTALAGVIAAADALSVLVPGAKVPGWLQDVMLGYGDQG